MWRETAAQARGGWVDRNKLVTSRLPHQPDVLPERSPGDLQRENEKISPTKLAGRTKYHLYAKSRYLRTMYLVKRSVFSLYIIIALTRNLTRDSEISSPMTQCQFANIVCKEAILISLDRIRHGYQNLIRNKCLRTKPRDSNKWQTPYD